MKLKNIFFPVCLMFLAGTFATSCVDVDIDPEGNVTSSDQIKEAIKKDPSLLNTTVAGMVTSIANEYAVFPKSTRADDSGFPAICLSDGTNSGDVVGVRSGYNWFTGAASYRDRTYTYANPYIRWAIWYNQIKAANDLIDNIDADTDNIVLQQYLGLAYATRAYDYFQLVQAYAYTYVGHETEPAVPIYLSQSEGDRFDSSRQSVATVYTVIDEDLKKAENFLADYTRPSKTYINKTVVYGLKARVELVKNNWESAASYAQKAIDAAAAEGITPASIEDVSKVGRMFISLNETNWIWGLSFTESMLKTGGRYETWVAQISSLASSSYTTEAACYRPINVALWNTISDTDVRKGWWVDRDLHSPLITGLTWKYPSADAEEVPLGQATGNCGAYAPYTNVKFGVKKGEFLTGDTWGDFPMMRVEEMYLILAEAKGHQNESQGIAILEQFVKTYRDPSYNYAIMPTQSLVDEIWRQRRIELWCEGFAMQDILRLNKPMVRYSGSESAASNWHDAYKFNLPAGSDYLLLAIPNAEVDGNEKISKSDNNQYGASPKTGDNASLTDGVTNLW